MQRLLDHPVQHRRDAERPHPATGLRDFHPSHRLWLVRAAEQLLPDARPVLAAVALECFDGHPVDARGTAVRHHPRVRRRHVLAAQHFVDETPSLVPGCSAACHACLTLLFRYLGGSATYLSDRLGLLSPRSCVSFTSRTHRSGSAPQVRPFAGVRPATMASADSSLRSGPTTQPNVARFRREARSPRVLRVTFAPSTRRIYASTIRMTSGFRFFGPLALMLSPRIRFVFLGPELCLRLPPHLASRRRGCRSANGSRHQGP